MLKWIALKGNGVYACMTGVPKIMDYDRVKESLLIQFNAAAEQLKSNRRARILMPLLKKWASLKYLKYCLC